MTCLRFMNQPEFFFRIAINAKPTAHPRNGFQRTNRNHAREVWISGESVKHSNPYYYSESVSVSVRVLIPPISDPSARGWGGGLGRSVTFFRCIILLGAVKLLLNCLVCRCYYAVFLIVLKVCLIIFINHSLCNLGRVE